MIQSEIPRAMPVSMGLGATRVAGGVAALEAEPSMKVRFAQKFVEISVSVGGLAGIPGNLALEVDGLIGAIRDS